MEEMNDIRDFMKEINRNIEVIWGTAVDNTLGSKVKMTILATGFTMDDIPQIADKHKAEAQQMTEEELRREEERIEQQRREQKLLEKYYGNAVQSTSRFSTRSRATILTEEELDDDMFITILEENPTYNRDPKIVVRARSKVGNEEPKTSTVAQSAAQPAAPRSEKKSSGRISFQ